MFFCQLLIGLYEFMEKTLWTIGHSNRTIEEFIQILLHYSIERIVDIRRLPGSDKYPWFNQDRLRESLKENGIEYVYLYLLSGRRPQRKESPNTEWRNKSFRAYADYMETDEFREGISELEKYALEKRSAIMCSEVLWWRCHRSMVADYMKSLGWYVINIFSIDKAEEHPYTSVAKIIDGKLRYRN